MASGGNDNLGRTQKRSARKVPSRYKQATSKTVRQMPRINTALFPDTKQSDTTSTSNVELSCSDFTFTPIQWNPKDAKNLSKMGKTTSTPAFWGLNMPSIQDAASGDQTIKRPHIKKKLISADVKRNKLRLTKSHARAKMNPNKLAVIPAEQQESKEEKVSSKVISESDVDLLYSQYIAAAFLESQAKKSLEEKCQNALDKLHKLWKRNQMLMMHEKYLDKEFDTFNYMERLFVHLKNMREAYEPVYSQLPTVIRQYAEIAEAVDSLRHKLPVSGISDFDFDGILKDIQTLLHSYNDRFSFERNELFVTGSSLSEREVLMNTTTGEVEGCTELLSKADTLLIHEASLKIAEIQLQEDVTQC